MLVKEGACLSTWPPQNAMEWRLQFKKTGSVGASTVCIGAAG